MILQPDGDEAEAPDRALFVRIGELLYGEQWQCQMARALCCSDRSVRYWVAGRNIPRGVWRDLLGLLDKRDKEMIGLASRLRVMLID